MSLAMKIPKNGTTRLETDVWIAGEALKRYYKLATTRKGIERLVLQAVSDLESSDSEFAKYMSEVRAEKIEQ